MLRRHLGGEMQWCPLRPAGDSSRLTNLYCRPSSCPTWPPVTSDCRAHCTNASRSLAWVNSKLSGWSRPANGRQCWWEHTERGRGARVALCRRYRAEQAQRPAVKTAMLCACTQHTPCCPLLLMPLPSGDLMASQLRMAGITHRRRHHIQAWGKANTDLAAGV